MLFNCYAYFVSFMTSNADDFRLFMNVSKPRPNDHPLLILFVVGGVTSSEVKLIKDTAAKYETKTQVRPQ